MCKRLQSVACYSNRRNSSKPAYAVKRLLSIVFEYLYAVRDSYNQIDGRQKHGKNTAHEPTN